MVNNITFEELIEKVKAYNPNADLELLKKVYEFADRAHKGHKRLSGDPFITHPLNVAGILANLEQDVSTITSAFLHDTVEDGLATNEQIKEQFGDEIAKLVEGVTKLGQLTFISKEARQAENFRKMFLAMGEDIRIIIVKMADRLHNMQTIEYLAPEKQKANAIETMEIFAPLAHRLGMWMLMWELEDLSFSVLEPESFREISSKVAEGRKEREEYIENFMKEISDAISKIGIAAEIKGRPKHLFSIHRKMKNQNLKFDEIYDLLAIRIIVDTVKECYSVLGVVHAIWRPMPGRFDDYIAMPKSNGYQSLHTTVIGPEGKPVEIQIRTKEMHRVAEYGIAAHWRYKEGETDKKLDLKMTWLRQLLDWQKDMKDAKDFMENLKIDLFADEVFIFTPKGDVFALSVGSTPLDFAYRVHTEVGHRCIGAKVNGRIVPLDHKLSNGDIIEVITGKADRPSLDWLNFLKTPGARTKVKGFFKKQKKEENVERGKAALETEVKNLGFDAAELISEQNMYKLIKELGFLTIDELYASIGYGERSAWQIAKRLKTIAGKKEIEIKLEEVTKAPQKQKRKHKKSQGILVTGLENVLVRFSKCCRPLPGEDIIGFVTKGRGVAIHRSDCPNITNLETPQEKMVKVEWDPETEILYPVEIEVEAFDRVGVLKDILSKVVETQTNVSAANVKTKRGSTAFIKLVMDIKDVAHFTKVLAAIREVSDVYDAYRADTLKSKRTSGEE